MSGIHNHDLWIVGHTYYGPVMFALTSEPPGTCCLWLVCSSRVGNFSVNIELLPPTHPCVNDIWCWQNKCYIQQKSHCKLRLANPRPLTSWSNKSSDALFIVSRLCTSYFHSHAMAFTSYAPAWTCHGGNVAIEWEGNHIWALKQPWLPRVKHQRLPQLLLGAHMRFNIMNVNSN